MDSRKPPPRSTERRARQRTSRDHQTTSLVQMILLDPDAAGDMLESDVRQGGSLDVVLGLLDAAEAVFRLRGVDAGAKLAALRQRLQRLAG